MITLSRIAKLANVSVSTASKAFSMSNEVSEETRQVIFDIAKQHGCFKKYYKAKYPRYVIAVICPEYTSRYYCEALALIQKCLADFNCETVVASTGYSEQTERDLVDYYSRYTTVDGIIFIGSPSISDVDIPHAVVFSGESHAEYTKCTIHAKSDYYDKIYEIIGYYLSKGVTDIGFVGETLAMQKSRHFIKSYKEQISGKEPVVSITEKRFEEGGYEAMQRLFEQNRVPRAPICAYDYMAIGAMKCIKDHGLKIPDDVAVVGMDDLPESAYLSPPLASVDTNIKQACTSAAAELMNYLLGNPYRDRVIVSSKLHLRESAMIK